ncbi:beta-lactamase-type transpeptidase fold domain-containing protein [Leptodontidium sp. 2 PMI_412]|nr:beta-lactamase-type transpeptidase fold domain-containing protein [Leptodontidium sp. 2 PMI_412]
MPINAHHESAIQASLDNVTSKGSIPGIVFVSVDRRGNLITSNCSGRIGKSNPTPMSLDTVFWIASCTKMITGIACMQLVEQGKIGLDDSHALYDIIPELKDKKVLQLDGTLVEKKRDITLRMLLNHTSGFGFSLSNEKLRDWSRPVGIDELEIEARHIREVPLVNQPGETWEYGTSIDLAGIIIEEISGKSLDDYFQDYIFKPLGIKSMGFFPTDEMIHNLAYMHQKLPDGTLWEVDHLLRKTLTAKTSEERSKITVSGGGGCFAKPTDYCQILATLMNNGLSPKTGQRILSSDTVDLMFKDSIPGLPWKAPTSSKPQFAGPFVEQMFPLVDETRGWGLTFMLSNVNGDAETRLGKNTGSWSGLPNMYYWMDREKGIAGMIASQCMPMGEPDVLMALDACQAAVYGI